jgi:hypothetical protein
MSLSKKGGPWKGEETMEEEEWKDYAQIVTGTNGTTPMRSFGTVVLGLLGRSPVSLEAGTGVGLMWTRPTYIGK